METKRGLARKGKRAPETQFLKPFVKFTEVGIPPSNIPLPDDMTLVDERNAHIIRCVWASRLRWDHVCHLGKPVERAAVGHGELLGLVSWF